MTSTYSLILDCAGRI